ncbi:hypothetical protein [Flavobacterium sp.]
MTKKIFLPILFLLILNTFYCEAQNDSSARKLVFAIIGTNIDVTKDEFLDYYSKSKNALLKSPYFNSREDFAPSGYRASAYNLSKLDYRREMDNIINTASFKKDYKNDTISNVYVKWDYKSKVFEDDAFGYVCKMDVSLNRIFANHTSYAKNTLPRISQIDSVEINYSYSYPVKIDSLQIDFSALTSKKISSNIYVEKFSINGLILDIKDTDTDEFIYLKAFDSKNNDLYCRLYNENKIPTARFVNEFAEYYVKLIEDVKAHTNDSNKAKEAEEKLDSLKIHSYLFSIPSKTKKITLYFSKKRFEKTGTKFISN